MTLPDPNFRPAASFVIPTRNRKDVLLETVRAALAQDVPAEVLILDDGSTDGTPEAVGQAFPTSTETRVRYFRLEGPNGPCVLRNLGTAMARAPIVFPIDDDSILSTPHIVRQVLAQFDHPRVACVAIPYVNANRQHERPPFVPPTSDVHVLSEYVGCAHALRRDAFLGVGGYVEETFYTVEEWEMSLRLLNAGYVVRAGTGDLIQHHESPSRNHARWHTTGAQNALVMAYYFVPGWRMPLHLAGTTLNNLRHGRRIGALKYKLGGLWAGAKLIAKYRDRRSPVAPAVYLLQRRLRKQGPLPLSAVESSLPPLRPFPPAPVAPDLEAARADIAGRRAAAASRTSIAS